jgi:hypothetical protein
MLKTLIILALSGMSTQAGLTKLEAISMIETGNDDRAVGRAGEISRYQIKPRLWHQYTDSSAYRDPRVASWVAAQHLQDLETAFRAKTGREPTDFDRYVLWNGGLTYYARLHFSPHAVKPVIRERAQRYVNLRQSTLVPSMTSLIAWAPTAPLTRQ